MMNPEFMADLVINLFILCVFLLVLGVGCLIADFVFPHIRPLQKWLTACRSMRTMRRSPACMRRSGGDAGPAEKQDGRG